MPVGPAPLIPEHWKFPITQTARPSTLGAVRQALTEFWKLARPPDAESAALFDAAVMEVVENLLQHARPATTYLSLGLAEGHLAATFLDAGRGWVGQPDREGLLQAIVARGGALAAVEPLLEQMLYERGIPVFRAAHRWWLVMPRTFGEVPAARGPERPPAHTATYLAPPLRDLVRSAVQIAAEERVDVPHVDRSDEVGILARALQSIESAAVAREALIESAPLAITRASLDGTIRYANQAFLTMHGYRRRDEVVGRLFTEMIHPDDREKNAAKFISMIEGHADHYTVEKRNLRADGSSFWTRTTVALMRGPDGRGRGYVTIIEDITERRRQTQRAARVQQQLMPRSTPSIEGYQLAGACVPAQDVAGDFYDWVLTDDGHLDITLADVMGKGFGAAMVMATLRTALRIVPRELGPAERARLAASSMELTLEEDDGLFVTLFLARVHLASGRIRYLDAGHGHWAIRRRSGELAHSPGPTAMPLFVQPGMRMAEREVSLELGETLLAYSDGLIEVEDEMLDIAQRRQELDEASSADDMVAQLLAGTPTWLSDDVTIVVLRRLARVVRRRRNRGSP